MRTATVAGALFAAIATASDVHDLKKDTFGEFVKENDLVLAECKSHSPPLIELSTTLLMLSFSFRTMVRSLQGSRA
jgi:protein disulfide-isomerase A1